MPVVKSGSYRIADARASTAERSATTVDHPPEVVGSDETPNVVLSTIGKFHTFDLARQMHRLKALNRIFSGYPRYKLAGELIPLDTIRTFPWIHAPYMKIGSRLGALKTFWERQDGAWFDRYVCANLPACDVFCGLSGSALITGRLARQRGAAHVCDRGSSHIRFQDAVLREEYELQGIRFQGIDSNAIYRDELEYDEADVITVPSRFVFNSFVMHGVPARKVRVVPYGVDLKVFYRTGEPSPQEFRVLFVGSVSIRKGISYLARAFAQLSHPKKHLTLIGPVDAELQETVRPLSEHKNISILGHIPQSLLKHHMSRSHVLVLPSIEEGFGMVQAQALACGCPVIATTNTGATELFTHGAAGFVIQIRNIDELTERMQQLADDADLQRAMSAKAFETVNATRGWDQYGERMYALFRQLTGRHSS